MKSINLIIYAIISLLLVSVVYAVAPVLNSVLGGAQEPEPTEDTLELYISGDISNATYFLDGTDNNNDGENFGVNRTFGQLGQAMLFDGEDDEIEISFDESLNLTDFTIVSWFKLSGNYSDFTGLVTRKMQGNLRTYGTLLKSSVGNEVGILITRANDCNTNIYYKSADVEFNRWYQHVVTYDNSTLAIEHYLDGVNVASDTHHTSGICQISAENLFIGNEPSTAGRFFNGTIDEVKIYSRALTSAQINQSYQKDIGKDFITTQMPLAASPNRTNSTDQDGDFIVPQYIWYKDGVKNATANECLGHNNSVLCMPMDERNITGLVEDYSVQNNDGNITGARHTNNSKVGFGAFEFDGTDDNLRIGAEQLTLLANFSIALWVKWDGTPTGEVSWISQARTSPTLDGIQFGRTDGNGLRIVIRNANSNGDVSATWTPLVNRFYHVGIVYNDGHVTFYLDGEVFSQGASSLDSAGDSGRSLVIGGSYDEVAGQGFDGIIDNLQIFNTTLSNETFYQMYWGEVGNGGILNSSLTRIGDNWNVSVSVFDNESLSSTPINFSFPQINSCGYAAYEGTWDIEGADDCTIDRNHNLEGNDIIIKGEGTFNFNGFNLTNWNNVVLRGTSATQRLIVSCIKGGCFKQ